MVQFAKTQKQKEDEKGGPKKPKKELGAGMDIAQVVLPMIASIAGTPLAGAAVGALLEGAESKLEGGTWKEALMKGVMSGALSGATGGIAGGVAGEAGKEAGKQLLTQGSIQGAKSLIGKEALKEAGKGTFETLVKEGGKAAVGETAKGAAKSAATDKLIAESSQFLTQGSIKDAQSVLDPSVLPGAAGGAGAETEAKRRFTDQITSLGEEGLGMYQQAKAEGAQKRGQNEAINAMMQEKFQQAMAGNFVPTKSSFYTPYGR